MALQSEMSSVIDMFGFIELKISLPVFNIDLSILNSLSFFFFVAHILMPMVYVCVIFQSGNHIIPDSFFFGFYSFFWGGLGGCWGSGLFLLFFFLVG